MEKKNKGPFAFVLILSGFIGAFAGQFAWALATGQGGQAHYLLTLAMVFIAYKGLMLIPPMRRLVNSDTSDH